MGFILKKNRPAFTVTDGLLAGRSYKHGRTYDFVPREHTDWFAPVGSIHEAPAQEAAMNVSSDPESVPVPRPQVEPPPESLDDRERKKRK